MSKSCKNAIKFNDKLDNVTSQKLVLQLLHCEHPLYCVHGKSFIIHFLKFIGRNSIYPLSDMENIVSALKHKKPKRKFMMNF